MRQQGFEICEILLSWVVACSLDRSFDPGESNLLVVDDAPVDRAKRDGEQGERGGNRDE